MSLTLTLSRPTGEGTARSVSRSFQNGWIRRPTEDDSPSPIRWDRAGAKGWQANVRPKEHKWAVRQGVGGEQASTREARQSLTAFCRAQRRERTEQTLTRGEPPAERPRAVSRGRSSV